MRTKEEINKDYNMSCLKIGHLITQIHLRDNETALMENEKNREIAAIENLVRELQEIEKVRVVTPDAVLEAEALTTEPDSVA